MSVKVNIKFLIFQTLKNIPYSSYFLLRDGVMCNAGINECLYSFFLFILVIYFIH